MKLTAEKPTVPIIAVILILCIIITGVSIMFFRNHGDEENGSKRITDNSITDIEFLNLRLSGMRITEEYELTVKGSQTELSYYTVSYAGSREDRNLVKRVVLDTQTVIDALNDFKVIKWDGFHGKHPRGVLDGTMFSLSATLNGGQKLYADGSENFPKHFNEFEKWLYEALKDCEEIN